MGTGTDSGFRVGKRWVDPSANDVNGVRIDARAMGVLVALVEAAPHVMSVAAMLERVWPNVVVVDNVVHQAIAQLRRALGDETRSPRYIETVPRRGYRFIAEIEKSGPGQPMLDAPTGTSTAVAIAVVPFTNMSSDPEQAFFSDGISEDILNGLAQSADLIVRPRSSSFRFDVCHEDSQTIGRRLNVGYVVEGSVRRSGNRVRVSAQLIDVEGNRSIWSERFDHELIDIFAVQDAITEKILSALDARLFTGKRARTFVGSEAYDAFLRGRRHFNRSEFDDAETWLAKAVQLDPGNADAWALRVNINR